MAKSVCDLDYMSVTFSGILTAEELGLFQNK